MDFSILVPVYKAEKYLEATIRSALVQKGGDFEILLVEDGSPDQSAQVCDRLAAQYPDRIRVIHRPHEGTVKTRRFALSEARGDFILWLDSDDLLLPDCLSVLMDFRRRHPSVQAILYEMEFLQETDGSLERRPALSPQPRIIEGKDKEQLYELLISGNRLDSLCIKAMARNLYTEDPSDYGPVASNPYGEDALHCLYPLSEAKQVALLPNVLYQYRIHSGSVMHVADIPRMEDRLNPAKWSFFEPFLSRWNMANPVHRERLRASSYKAVLDGVLHLWEHNHAKKELKSFVHRFVKEHPALKELSRSQSVSRKLRLQLKLFSREQIPLLMLLLRIYRLKNIR